ncbi:MAG: hypothetical protein ACFFAQ_01530 [Promethearchaeota archaeon]
MKVRELWRYKYSESILGIDVGDINNNLQKEIIAYSKSFFL